MTFRENLLKKIEIEKLFDRVAASFAFTSDGQKIDREAMIQLLQIAGYRHRRERGQWPYHRDDSCETGVDV